MSSAYSVTQPAKEMMIETSRHGRMMAIGSRFASILPLKVVVALVMFGCSHGGDQEESAGLGEEAANGDFRPRVAPPLRLELVARIDGNEAEFGRIGGLIADGDGHLYVMDELAREILVFDADGARTGTIGREGNGPGEFGALTSIAWKGDSVAALDIRARRVSLFPREGGAPTTFPWPAEAGRPRRLYSVGATVYAAGTFPRDPPNDAPAVTSLTAPRPQPALRYSAFAPDRSAVLFTALQDTVSEPRGFDCEAPQGVIATFGTPLMGRAGPLRAFTDSTELAIATLEGYRIDLVDIATGDTVRTIAREYPALPVSDAEWERATAEYREQERKLGPLACDLESMRPEFLPVLRSIIADEAGRLWVEARTAEGFSIAVIDRDGRLIGEAPLPPRDERVPLYARDGRLYLVTIDDLDVQSIVVYETGVEAG